MQPERRRKCSDRGQEKKTARLKVFKRRSRTLDDYACAYRRSGSMAICCEASTSENMISRF